VQGCLRAVVLCQGINVGLFGTTRLLIENNRKGSDTKFILYYQ
jgi:hypothetical protein